MCATVPDLAWHSCSACVCDGSRTAPTPVQSVGKDTARRMEGLGIRWQRKMGKAAYSQSKPQPDCKAKSCSHPQKQPEEHPTRKDLCWVSPRVLSNLQSCPLWVLGGGQPAAHGQHGIILACLLCFRVIMSQQKLNPFEINFFFHELVWSLLDCLKTSISTAHSAL